MKVFLPLVIATLLSCNLFVSNSHHSFGYDLQHPINVYKMGKSLKGISGINYINDSCVACIQDKQEIIYLYNLKKDKISKRIDLHKTGDFEDITIIDSTAYLLRSNGKIYEISNFLSDSIKVKKHETKLSKNNNAEGMCYSKDLNALLIACKGAANLDGQTAEEDKKAIYRFDLGNKHFHKKPYLLLDDADNSFAPSAIAIHPITKEIFVVASVGKIIKVYKPDGTFEDEIRLDKQTFPQPEGITFAPNGDMFISSEGKSHKGTIKAFRYKKELN